MPVSKEGKQDNNQAKGKKVIPQKVMKKIPLDKEDYGHDQTEEPIEEGLASGGS